MALTIEVLGSLSVRSGGRSTKIPKKGRGLLGFLAVTRCRTGRERVADLLWPYQGTEQARHSLRNCLMEIRKTDRSAVGTNFTECWTGVVSSDLDRFEQLASSQSLAHLCAAMELYRGPLLDGFQIDSESWDDWLQPERERVQAIAADVLTRVTTQASAAADHALAIRAAKRLVALDPLCEPSHCLLMGALVAGGQRAEAIRTYNDCVAMLRRELGIGPDYATQKAREAIGDGRFVITAEAPAPEATIHQLPPPPRPTPATAADTRVQRRSRLARQLGAMADAADAVASASLRLRLAIDQVIETLEETARPEPRVIIEKTESPDPVTYAVALNA
jgi:DNA-binding SARP family transcriptional activator